MVEKIRMNVDETLELEYLVEQISDDTISITDEPTSGSSSVDYIATQKGVFNPSETGIHKLDINGQTVEIDVIDIPDSVVLQFDAGTYSTGDSAWTDDVGTNDAAITGAPQSSTLSNGDPSVTADGTDDHGNFNLPPEIDGLSLNNFAWEIEVQYTASGRMVPLGIRTNDQILLIDLNKNETFSDVNGQIRFILQDSNSNNIIASPSTNPNLDDGNRHVILFNVVDASNNNIEIFIDGTSVSLTFNSQNSPGNWISWGNDCALFGLNVDGTVSDFLDGSLGTVRMHDSDQTGQTI
jgi:hypothetical protein